MPRLVRFSKMFSVALPLPRAAPPCGLPSVSCTVMSVSIVVFFVIGIETFLFVSPALNVTVVMTPV